MCITFLKGEGPERSPPNLVSPVVTSDFYTLLAILSGSWLLASRVLASGSLSLPFQTFSSQNPSKNTFISQSRLTMLQQQLPHLKSLKQFKSMSRSGYTPTEGDGRDAPHITVTQRPKLSEQPSSSSSKQQPVPVPEGKSLLKDLTQTTKDTHNFCSQFNGLKQSHDPSQQELGSAIISNALGKKSQ